MPTHSLLRFFWHHVKPYKYYYFVMLLAPAFASCYSFAYNYAIKMLIDLLSSSHINSYHDVIAPIVLLIGSQFTLDFMWRISDICVMKSMPYIRRNILSSSYEYVQHHAYSYFQNNFSGSISSKIKGILDGFTWLWNEIHHGLSLRILTCIINLAALSVVDIHLCLMMTLWATIYVPVMYRLSSKLHGLSFQQTEYHHHLIGQISDRISNMVSVFSFARRPYERQTLDHAITTELIPKHLKVDQYQLIVQTTAGGLHLIMYVTVLLYTIHLKMIGLISVGDFALTFGLAFVIENEIWRLTSSLQEFSRAMGDFKSALAILNTPHQHQDHPKAAALTLNTPTIEFKNLRFGYTDDTVVFDDFNLTIKSGEKIGIVGVSGAGKSTLINLLLKYFPVQQGEIFVNDHNINMITQDSLRSQIAVIPQDTLLFHRSLIDNIRYGRIDASDDDVVRASQQAHIHDFIMGLPEQYQTFVGERGIKLSGGQRQRIAIARAFLKNAPIIVLDEATSALDSHTEKSIQDSLNHLIDDQQKTIIAIAHRLSTLKHMDRIIVLDHGKIAEQGTHDDLIANSHSLYKKLWDLQMI